MAESRGPQTLGSTPGAPGTATHSTETNTSGIVGKVKEQATAQLSSQKDRATEGLGSVAQAVRETTRVLRDGQHDTAARYAEQTAEQIERFSQRLRNKDVGELMNDAQQLARRNPALFVGGAFAIGLLGARFLKSSSPESRYSYGNYGTGGYGGSNYGDRGYGGTGNYGSGGTGYAGGSGSTGYSGAGTGYSGGTGSSGFSGGTGYSGGTGASGYGGQTSDIGLTGTGLGTDTGTSGFGNTESVQGSENTTAGTGGSENAYGNKVPGSSRKASDKSKRTDYPPTEGR